MVETRNERVDAAITLKNMSYTQWSVLTEFLMKECPQTAWSFYAVPTT
jgi:hypothetical protein